MQTTKFDASSLATRLQVAAESEANLELITTGVVPKGGLKTVLNLSDRLTQWLLDLRLLRHVPLAYLLPDPQLLPVESIRFFQLDATWADRLVDGALSAADIGTLDMTFTFATAKLIRAMLDDLLHLDAAGTITGMLIRSQLVARWPDLLVNGYPKEGESPDPASALPILRKDLLSKSIMIVLMAGVPAEVQLREPHVGLRFGVELPAGETDPALFEVPKRDQNGKQTGGPLPVAVSARRVVDIQHIASPTGGRDIAVNLIRPPYVQRFHHNQTNPGSTQPIKDGAGQIVIKVGNKTTLFKPALRGA